MSRICLILALIILELGQLSSASAELEKSKQTKPLKESEKTQDESAGIKTDTDDRLNINLNRGHAHAIGPAGSFSGSDAETYGIEAGIRYPGGYHRPLYSTTGGRGSSYSQGPFAPKTYAGGNTRFGNGYMGGNINAGYEGGLAGAANAESLTHHIEIPIDPFGTVFYSNLKDKKEPVVKETTKKENQLLLSA